jgi:hypothetical protein
MYRLCCINAIEEEDLMRDLKIIPGNYPKFKKFLERVRELFLNEKNNMNRTVKPTNNLLTQTASSSGKPKMSITSSNFGTSLSSKITKKINSPSLQNTTSNTNPNSLNQNASYKAKSAEPVCRKSDDIVQSFFKGQGFGFNYYIDEKAQNINVVSNKENLKDCLREDEINTEIDKLLNFYMSQLKDSIIDNDCRSG